jgi:hypothetical protein
MATFVCFLQIENGNGKFPFVQLANGRKREVCFPWSAKKKQSTIIVSANVPFYVNYIVTYKINFLGQQKRSNQQLLFQQTCPSMLIT